MTNAEKLQEFFSLREEIEAYHRCIGKVAFDMECCAPEEGMEQAGEDMAVVGRHLFALENAPRYIELLTQLHTDHEDLTEVQISAVEHLYDQYTKVKNFSPEFAYQLDSVSGKCYSAWLSAKKNKDYSLFRDIFAQTIDMTRQAVQLRDTMGPTIYDTLLDDTEKGGSIAQLDAFFAALKARILPLMHRIAAEGKNIRTDFMTRPVPIYKQEAFSRKLLKLEGLRESALVLMTTEHPFTDNYGPNDVRVTTHYYEDLFVSNMFSTLHEGGHALFMQNEPAELHANHAANHMTNGMHECISRFYENLIGRSEAFVNYLYPIILQETGDTFADITPRELYEAVNTAQPGLSRMEADELTYCLHIMIRYELEKAFINGDITVDEIPALWNAKYKEYLGLDVPDDSVGCLQDVHWAGVGGYGYFPSYALGNAYGAQILHTMKQEFDVEACVARGDLLSILDWMKTHVFARASLLTPDQWIREITGESLNVNYYLDYMEDKFSKVYGLK